VMLMSDPSIIQQPMSAKLVQQDATAAPAQ
jgi:hypothetical protein